MLTSEADVLRTLHSGTYTLEQLYRLCEQRTEVARDGGHDPIPEHAGDRRWKRRVRGALGQLRVSGRAKRIGRSVWAIDGTAERPERLVVDRRRRHPAEFELRLNAAVELWQSWTSPWT